MPPDVSQDLPPVPRFRPYEPEFRMAMGLEAVAAPDWLEFAEDHAAQMAERDRLMAERPEAVLACLPEAKDAAAELLQVVIDHLCTHHAAWFHRDGDKLWDGLRGRRISLRAADPLAILGGLVQEDFCLMQAGPEGHRLTGAVLCFPSRWSLVEKLGQPLPLVHAAVPFYGDRLAHPVERFFTHLKDGKLAQRLNWSVIDDPTLFQLGGKYRGGHDATISPDNALQRLWLRVERQTFRRLPVSRAVVFGIRMHVTPLDRVAREPGEAARLSAALRALPLEMAAYKSTGRFSAALLDALASV